MIAVLCGVKRFPFSNEWLAWFRFAWSFSRDANRGAGCSDV